MCYEMSKLDTQFFFIVFGGKLYGNVSMCVMCCSLCVLCLLFASVSYWPND